MKRFSALLVVCMIALWAVPANAGCGGNGRGGKCGVGLFARMRAKKHAAANYSYTYQETYQAAPSVYQAAPPVYYFSAPANCANGNCAR